MAKWQRFRVDIRKGIGESRRRAIGLEIIEHIKSRTKKGLDKDGNPWTGRAAVYSESYRKSADFKIAKGNQRRVDLDLSSEMLNSIKILSNRSGSLLIGYERGNSALNGKVEGNRLGTYGKSTPSPGKQRDFLGVEEDELEKIQNRYDYNRRSREKVKERVQKINAILGG